MTNSETFAPDTTADTLPRSTWHTIVAYVPKVLIALALLAFIGYLIVYVYYAVQLFRFPFDYDQGEGFELMDTILFSQGEWPYRDNNSYPFYSSNYPPLFHVLIVPLVWLFGPQYWTGRLLSFVGTLITAAAIGYAVQRGGRRWWLASLSGLAFLASNYVYHVGALFRQHMFMVMFETLAVVLLTVTIEQEDQDGRKRPWQLLGVMILLLAAGYTKQLAYATVIAVFIFLFLREPLRAIKWAIPFGLVTGLIFLGINVATNGQWLLNTVTANLNPFIPGQAEGLYRQWFSLHIVLTVAAVAYAFYQLYFERLSAYSIWFIVAAINGVTAGKWGAGESYFATAIAASCILSGLAFSRLLNWSRARTWASRKAAFWASVAVPSVIALLYLFQAYRVFHLPTHTPFLAGVANALGYPTEVDDRPANILFSTASAGSHPLCGLGRRIACWDGRRPTLIRQPGRKSPRLVAQGRTAAFSEEAGFNLYLGRDVVTNPTQLAQPVPEQRR